MTKAKLKYRSWLPNRVGEEKETERIEN